MSAKIILLVSVLVLLQQTCCGRHLRHHSHQWPCTRCPPGYGVRRSCSAADDTVCERCVPGTFSPHHSYRAPCFVCSRCGEGLYESQSCTDISDTVCDTCATLSGPRNDDFHLKCRGWEDLGWDKGLGFLNRQREEDTTQLLPVNDSANDVASPESTSTTPLKEELTTETPPPPAATAKPRVRYAHIQQQPHYVEGPHSWLEPLSGGAEAYAADHFKWDSTVGGQATGHVTTSLVILAGLQVFLLAVVLTTIWACSRKMNAFAEEERNLGGDGQCEDDEDDDEDVDESSA